MVAEGAISAWNLILASKILGLMGHLGPYGPSYLGNIQNKDNTLNRYVFKRKTNSIIWVISYRAC